MIHDVVNTRIKTSNLNFKAPRLISTKKKMIRKNHIKGILLVTKINRKVMKLVEF